MIMPRPADFYERADCIEAERVCQVTGEKFVIRFTHEQFLQWQHGAHIQNVLPQLTPDQREILISGTTPAEWKEIFDG
jgi:hypothetical protein